MKTNKNTSTSKVTESASGKTTSSAGKTPTSKKTLPQVPTKPKFTMKNPGKPAPFAWTEKKPTNKVASKAPQKPVDQAGKEPAFNIEFIPTTLYEYSMGIKNIGVSFNEYEDRAMYVSKPMKIDGNVMELELLASEDHPVFDEISGRASTRQTSIEYSVSFKERPSREDWVPILPKDQGEVKGERLFIDKGVAVLRFPAEPSTVVVYRNAVKVDKNEYAMQSNESIWFSKPEGNAMYTVDYVPNTRIRDPHKIELLEHVKERIKTRETFKGGASHNNTIELSHYPYVDYGYINQKESYDPNTDGYQPVRVTLRNASIIGENRKVHPVVEPQDANGEVFTSNRTLYKENSWSTLRPYSLESLGHHGFDYYQWRNKLTFTERFNAANIRENMDAWHGNADIEVEYEYLASSFRFKAVLRKNSLSEATVTPRLYNYQLLFKTMK